MLLGSGSAAAFNCSDLSLPSRSVICSDPELINLADERQKAFDEALARLGADQRKELLADQQGWAKAYAAACGVPPDKPPPNPVPPAVKDCFKRAAVARLAYLRVYGAPGGNAEPTTPPPTAKPAITAADTTERIGPGFDCAKATQPLARLICGNAELSKTDLRFNQAYQALRQQLDPASRGQLQREDTEFINSVLRLCSIPGQGTEVVGSSGCVVAQYDRKRSEWLSRLSAAAREEADRPIEEHVALQKRLRELGYLPATVKVDGVYDPATRAAIVSWQNHVGRAATGFFGNADVTAFAQEQVQPSAQTTATAGENVLKAETRPEVAQGSDQQHSDSTSSSGWLGVQLSQRISGTGPFGVGVASVIPDSPAFRAGLMPGDIILSFNGISLVLANDLTGLLRSTPPSSKVTLAVWRNGQKMVLTATLGPALESAQPPKPCARWNENIVPRIEALEPIECISPSDMSVGLIDVVTIPVSKAYPAVRDFIATVNGRLAQAQSGRRLSDEELEADQKLTNIDVALTSIAYPTTEMILQGGSLPVQLNIDRAFMQKALGYIKAIDDQEKSKRASEQRAAHQEEDAKRQQEKNLEAEAREKQLAFLDLHQWHSGTSDPDAIVSFMGVVVGKPASGSLTNFDICSPVAKVDGQLIFKNVRTCAKGSNFIVILLNGENISALSYEFSADQAEAVARTMVTTYGKPDHVDTIDVQNALGVAFTSKRMQWDTPVGLMEFDERYEFIDKGRIMVNPDKITAIGTPDKF
jgi:uncharacterized protein/peptidoglycan hydrolase-like protein with peptidoglycan-binding domain